MIRKTFVCTLIFAAGVCAGVLAAVMPEMVETEKVRRQIKSDMAVLEQFDQDEKDPRSAYMTEKMKGMNKISHAHFFQCISSENNDTFAVFDRHTGKVLVSELAELDMMNRDMPVKVRYYFFREDGNNVSLIITREQETGRVIRCQYSFNDRTSYLDTNGNGVWDKSKIPDQPAPADKPETEQEKKSVPEGKIDNP